jgi:hypothetical protein
MFILHDLTTKELIGGFNSFNEAFFYYTTNNLLELLHIYRNFYLLKSVNNMTYYIEKVRNLEESILQIKTYELEYYEDEKKLSELAGKLFFLVNKLTTIEHNDDDKVLENCKIDYKIMNFKESKDTKYIGDKTTYKL